MRRPRRHRWLTVSVFFIAYSVFQAVYKPSNASEPLDKALDETGPIIGPTNKPDVTAKDIIKDITSADETLISGLPGTPPSEKEKDTEEDAPAGGKKGMKELSEEEEPDKKGQKDAGYVEDTETEEAREEERANWKANPTVKPLRVNCSPPAIEQFPKPLMGQSARKHGGLIVHILVAVFTFIGLAIVCDEYFVSSLDRICEELKLAPDVAGATFMAAGSSAPELATVVIGVFCAQDDIGVSGVIGSAVFNIMFVISVCALCAGTVSHLNWWPLCRDCFFYAISILVMLCTIANSIVSCQSVCTVSHLNWWPLCRDCFFYAISILVMLCTIANSIVSWPEALFMLIMYGVYCVALRFNTALERWAMTLPLPFKLPTREEQAALVTYRWVLR
ncbi:hypothetical protein PYW07_009956 [Mythimna separata]|uniref:Sodium/calcium exchanger membrane region domain-containing protein n=1 Tax=Mythimna separata TaxID=271217 RepID=A0AAD8DQK2_MYTSE|nr:hypothetical protein PYW07_009956 [Mythimna separata]